MGNEHEDEPVLVQEQQEEGEECQESFHIPGTEHKVQCRRRGEIPEGHAIVDHPGWCRGTIKQTQMTDYGLSRVTIRHVEIVEWEPAHRQLARSLRPAKKSS